MSSREQFEAWASRHHGVLSIGKVDGHYSNPRVNDDWFVWQASRADLVIDLPYASYKFGDVLCMPSEEVLIAVNDAGVRYK